MNLYACHPMRSSSKRSTVLLVSMTTMMIYILLYDVSYPYDVTPKGSWLSEVYRFAEKSYRGTTMTPFRNISDGCTVCNFYDVSGFAKDLGFKCVKTKTSPGTTVCIYDEWSDMYISHDLLYTGMWEPKVVRDFQEILGHNRHVGFIDLGANVGFYTLLAAKMGHKVLSVEPYRDSIYRIHRALFLEDLGQNVYVLENGVSDKREKATLRKSGNNQGDHQLKLQVRPCQGACPTIVQTIQLNDLVDAIGNNFSSAVLKLDIQGFEHRAFDRANLLFEKIDIPYILMEWFVMKTFYVSNNHTSSDKFMVEHMLYFLLERDYRPYSLSADGGGPLDPGIWHEWPFDIVWRRLPNAAEKRTMQSNHFRVWPPT